MEKQHYKVDRVIRDGGITHDVYRKKVGWIKSKWELVESFGNEKLAYDFINKNVRKPYVSRSYFYTEIE
jgi:hypothetical protein